MRRREILGNAPLLFCGAPLAFARASQQQPTPKGPVLPEELSAEELELVNRSAMAKDVLNFYGKGFS